MENKETHRDFLTPEQAAKQLREMGFDDLLDNVKKDPRERPHYIQALLVIAKSSTEPQLVRLWRFYRMRILITREN